MVTTNERIRRTLERHRGYKWGYSWKTTYGYDYSNHGKDNDIIFNVYHHGAKIFSYNISKSEFINDCMCYAGWTDVCASNTAIDYLKDLGYLNKKIEVFCNSVSYFGLFTKLYIPKTKKIYDAKEDEYFSYANNGYIDFPFFKDDYDRWIKFSMKLEVKQMLRQLDIKNMFYSLKGDGSGYVVYSKEPEIVKFIFDKIQDEMNGLVNVSQNGEKVIVMCMIKSEGTKIKPPCQHSTLGIFGTEE